MDEKRDISRRMDKSSSIRTLRDILRPYQILSCILGIRLLKLPSGWKSIKLNVIYSIFLFALHIYSWKYISPKERIMELDKSQYCIMFLSNHFIVIISIAVGLFKDQLWENSIRRLEEIDMTLQALGSNSRFPKIYVRTMIEFIFFILFFLALICFDGYYTKVYMDSTMMKAICIALVVILHAYGEIVSSTVTMNFLTMVRFIESELDRASDLLSDINVLPCNSIAMELIKYKGTKRSLKQFVKVLPSSQKINSRLDVTNQEIFRSRRLLQTIRQIHLELYKVSKDLNDLYGIQVFIIICLYFFYNTCFFYSTYIIVKKYGHTRDIILKELGSIPYFVFSSICKVIFINYTCDDTTQKMEKVNEIVYTFYAENTDYTIQQELKMFTLQMAHCQSTYSTFGLYSFNRKYIYSCVGVMMTYLTIMIQMSDSVLKNE